MTTKYDPAANLEKGNKGIILAGVSIGSFVGLVETVQWFAALYKLEIPDQAAQFLCGFAVAVLIGISERVRNWRKHGWRR